MVENDMGGIMRSPGIDRMPLVCRLFVICSLLLPSYSGADIDPGLLKLGADAVGAIKEAKDALDDLENVQKVVQSLEEGRAPGTDSNKWAKLADKYSSAADHLNHAALPTDFDASRYKFSLEELHSCKTRDASLAKAQGYLDELQAARERGQTSLATLEGALSDADTARQTLTYLIQVHNKLINVPEYGQIFLWDWFDLNTKVTNSLGALISALNAQKRKISAETAKLDVHIPNLRGNLDALNKLHCTVDGTWSGSFGIQGQVSPLTISFVTTGATVTGQWKSSSGPKPLTDLAVGADRSIRFTFDVSLKASGTIAGDYLSMSGNLTTARTGNGTWQLRKQ
jgi:hypothetical protein